MKNGDPRTTGWVKRQMVGFARDDEATLTALLLVSLDKPVTLETIQGWTDEQCMLAEDWAFNVHCNASDNNNRVPACPEFLKPYRGVVMAETLVERLREQGDWQSLEHEAADRIEELERQLADMKNDYIGMCAVVRERDGQFATARQQERERCAQKCEQRAASLRGGAAVARQCAADVRSLPDEEGK